MKLSNKCSLITANNAEMRNDTNEKANLLKEYRKYYFTIYSPLVKLERDDLI